MCDWAFPSEGEGAVFVAMNKSDVGQIVQRVGEVVESASHGFTAQCYRLYDSPPLGGFVRTEAPNQAQASGIYAVVCGITTGALDPGRPIVARGAGEEREEDVYRSNPQLSLLLRTSFEALIVAHGEGPAILAQLPPYPPRIHAFVYPCSQAEVDLLTRSMDFLLTLAGSPLPSLGMADEVIAACLRRASSYSGDPQALLVRAGRSLAVQMGGDLPRLNALLRRLSP